MTRQVKLTRGAFALVDDADFEAVVSVGRWCLRPTADGRRYAQHRVLKPDGRRTTQGLHAFLTGWPFVDHINGNGLDNRRENLRPATPLENAANAKRRRDNRSGYKGVSVTTSGRWIARIQRDRKLTNLGIYPTPEEAAVAYDAAAREVFGEFAWLNFPVGQPFGLTPKRSPNNATKTHCVRGHAFDKANTRIKSDGRRDCRQCERIRRRIQERTAA